MFVAIGANFEQLVKLNHCQSRPASRSVFRLRARMAIKSAIPQSIQRRAPKSARRWYRSAKELRKFLNAREGLDLSHGQRARIVQQGIMLLENFHVNLPLKMAMYAVDPARRLRLLQMKLDTAFADDLRFHREMIQIFNSLNDIHTQYLLPFPWNEYTAWLPFAIESFRENGKRVYLAAKVREEFFINARHFRRAVEIVSWNGMPIDKAVELFGAQSPTGAGNPAARRALAISLFTQRPLEFLPPPDEDWVVIGYRRRGAARVREVRIPWLVSKSDKILNARPGGMNLTGRVRELRRQLFATEQGPDWFMGEDIQTSSGKFGYLRIFTFDVGDLVQDFIDGIIAKVHSLSRNGLIIDVRGNEGGRTRAAETLLQIFARDYPHEKRIEPTRCCFINTPRTLRLCELQRRTEEFGPAGLRPWAGSIKRAIQTGVKFSSSHEITDINKCNDETLKQLLYPGPVLVITDGLTTSAAEIFAAGIQDHGGITLGTASTTAGAGANVRSHSQFRGYFKNEGKKSPFRPLPNNANFNIPFRRFQRVHKSAGLEIEDFGVIPDKIHVMTRRDIMEKNRDLKNYAGQLLLTIKPRKLAP
jgi:hypothetical protein